MRSSFVVAIATIALLGPFSQGLATDISSKAQLIGSISVPKTSTNIGGLSGISLNEDGSEFLAISDQGRFVSGLLQREGPAIKRIAILQDTHFKNLERKPVAKSQRDSEGLSV